MVTEETCHSSIVDIWSEPDSDGLSACSQHPEARFRPVDGCPACAANPAVIEDASGPGPAELARMAAIERGLADGLEWQRRASGTWERAVAVEKEAQSVRRFCTKRAKSIIRGEVEFKPEADRKGELVEVDSDREAREWLDLASKFTGHVLKAQDVQVKAEKLVGGQAADRDADAFLEQQNRTGLAAQAAKAGN